MILEMRFHVQTIRKAGQRGLLSDSEMSRKDLSLMTLLKGF